MYDYLLAANCHSPIHCVVRVSISVQMIFANIRDQKPRYFRTLTHYNLGHVMTHTKTRRQDYLLFFYEHIFHVLITSKYTVRIAVHIRKYIMHIGRPCAHASSDLLTGMISACVIGWILARRTRHKFKLFCAFMKYLDASRTVIPESISVRSGE